MFCFLIDPTGWAEIEGEAFAPGFFLWNSEVGKRSLGIKTFWFQAVCQNHIVWDATEVVDFSRKHTEEALDVLQKRGITRALAKEAVAIAETHGRFTIFALVDALTRLSARMNFAGDRAEADEKASALLRLVQHQPAPVAAAAVA